MGILGLPAVAELDVQLLGLAPTITSDALPCDAMIDA
jgi:hypothetical protein